MYKWVLSNAFTAFTAFTLSVVLISSSRPIYVLLVLTSLQNICHSFINSEYTSCRISKKRIMIKHKHCHIMTDELNRSDFFLVWVEVSSEDIQYIELMKVYILSQVLP